MAGQKDKAVHARVPVSDTFRKKSPFQGLMEHMEKVRECLQILDRALTDYYRGETKNFSGAAAKIARLEHEADLIKGNIRAHLPNSLLMPVDKKYFLWHLREQDAILDHAENLAQLIDMRPTNIPIKLKELFIEHIHLVAETVSVMEKAVEKFRDLVESSFIKKERELVKDLIREVHRKEWEADQKKFELTKEIYKMEEELSPMDVYHLLKIADWTDDIADHAENVADWLRAMIAK
ncbi:MAG TPA: TIGR00153 family protein [Thermoplasmatales archaeon]|nr:TIGR00153 family protein [Candidatus Thermoplasmatota archaeon]MDD5778931.1 TIGR00153 family protein [Candidatus Thermoplasmatota archaeon]HDS59379.1 TIGR00153 family protein [Thermoplasmatales archaeon]